MIQRRGTHGVVTAVTLLLYRDFSWRCFSSEYKYRLGPAESLLLSLEAPDGNTNNTPDGNTNTPLLDLLLFYLVRAHSKPEACR